MLLTLSIAGGTRLSTVTNGVAVFGLYGLAFIGSWVEQIGTLHGQRARRATVGHGGEPDHAERGAVAAAPRTTMQPPIMRDLHLTPFSPASVPSAAMVGWAAGYVVVALVLALRWFGGGRCSAFSAPRSSA